MTWLVASAVAVASAYFLWQRAIGGEIHRVDLDRRFTSPSVSNWLGTDELGRDLLARTTAGLAYSSSLMLFSLTGAVVVGIAVGAAAGYSRSRFVRRATDQVINFIWSIPGLILFIAVTTYFGRGFLVIGVTMAAVAWVPIARVVRLELEREQRRAYVTAMRAAGHRELTILRATLSNVALPIAISALTVALDLVAAEAGLSFLGLGLQPPSPSLGSLVYNGLYYSAHGWWLVLFPLLVLVGLVLGLKRILAAMGGTSPLTKLVSERS